MMNCLEIKCCKKKKTSFSSLVKTCVKVQIFYWEIITPMMIAVNLSTSAFILNKIVQIKLIFAFWNYDSSDIP
jgi:hypothetical protein